MPINSRPDYADYTVFGGSSSNDLGSGAAQDEPAFAKDPTPNAPRPPLNLDTLRRQLAGITEYLRREVWGRKGGAE